MSKAIEIKIAKVRAETIDASIVVLQDRYTGDYSTMEYKWWIHSTTSDKCICIVNSDGSVEYDEE